MGQRILAVVVVAALTLALPAAAEAKYRGSDVWQNIAPGNGTPYTDRYPLSNFQLDYHVDTGLNPFGDGNIASYQQGAAQVIWNLTVMGMRGVIHAFSWAFSLNLLTGPHGTLRPISAAVHRLQDRVLGTPWLAAGLACLGVYLVWMVAMRRHAEGLAETGKSLAFVVVGLMMVAQPGTLVGEAANVLDGTAVGVLTAASPTNSTSPSRVLQDVENRLMRQFVYAPWMVMQFGGLQHCVNTRKVDQDGFPEPVSCTSRLANVRRDNRRYAPWFLSKPYGSDERDAIYETLKDGRASQPGQPTVDKADSPAVDIMQQGGSGQRLALAAFVALGLTGPAILIGVLAVSIVLATLAVMTVLLFAPVALIAAPFPGKGHALFVWWFGKLLLPLAIKVIYSVLLVALLTATAALYAAADAIGGWFPAFLFTSAFYWGVFLKRHEILAAVGSTGDRVSYRHAQRYMGAALAPLKFVSGRRRTPVPT